MVHQNRLQGPNETPTGPLHTGRTPIGPPAAQNTIPPLDRQERWRFTNDERQWLHDQQTIRQASIHNKEEQERQAIRNERIRQEEQRGIFRLQ